MTKLLSVQDLLKCWNGSEYTLARDVTWPEKKEAVNMAKTAIDVRSLNGPLNDIAGRKTHQLAVTRDYISQPRISKTMIKHDNMF